MKIIWAQEPINPSNDGKTIFLAGPTPREQTVKSWRPEVVNELEVLYPSVSEVFIPEPKNGFWKTDYVDQVEWEWEAINTCDILAFWIPRDIEGGLPGFTTNVEFGYWLSKKKHIVLGYPPNAEKCKYLAWLLKKERDENPVHSVIELIEEIKKKAI